MPYVDLGHVTGTLRVRDEYITTDKIQSGSECWFSKLYAFARHSKGFLNWTRTSSIFKTPHFRGLGVVWTADVNVVCSQPQISVICPHLNTREHGFMHLFDFMRLWDSKGSKKCLKSFSAYCTVNNGLNANFWLTKVGVIAAKLVGRTYGFLSTKCGGGGKSNTWFKMYCTFYT